MLINNINYSTKRNNNKIDDITITMEDFMYAIKTIKPSAMRQIAQKLQMLDWKM